MSRSADSCAAQFHGCPSMADRNHTLVTGRRCLWAHVFFDSAPQRSAGTACGEDFAYDGTSSSSAPAYCGFTSTDAQSWLRALWSRTKACRIVHYTVITGGYDELGIISNDDRNGLPDVCHVAFLDEITRASIRDEVLKGWETVLLPSPPPFESPQRVAHSMKAVATRLFPSANATLYTDGKVRLKAPLAKVLEHFAMLTRKPYVVLENNPWGGGDPAGEFSSTVARLRAQAKLSSSVGSRLGQDLADLRRQRMLYLSEGRYSDFPGAIDASVIVQFRHADYGASGALQSGGGDPAPQTLIRWLECAWFTEISLMSHREQTSFFYVVDKLGVRGLVHMVRRNFQGAIAKLLVADPSHANGKNHSSRGSVAGPRLSGG